MNITGLEAISETMKYCLELENVQNGLLEDVESIITVYNNEEGIEEPAIWMVQHPTVAEEKVNLAQKLRLRSPFEFVCIEYDEDPSIAESKSQNLATLTALSVLKNYKQAQLDLDYTPSILKLEFNTFRPIGEISVQGKAEKVPVSGIIIDVVHLVDWNNCCKKLEKLDSQDLESQDQNNDDDVNENIKE